jgi:hypothetical protein
MTPAGVLERVVSVDTPAITDVQIVDMRAALGQALDFAIAMAHLSHKEAAAACGVDAAELGRWITGERRMHLDRILATPKLKRHVLIALALLDPELDVATQIRIPQVSAWAAR